MSMARIVVQGLDHIEGIEPVNCDAIVGTRGLEFTVRGTLAAIRAASAQLIGGRTSATVNGDPVSIVANSVVEAGLSGVSGERGTHQINVTASFQKR